VIENFRYAYLLGDLFFTLVWIFLFFHRHDLRKEIITTSLIAAPMGLIFGFFYLRDYWHPELFNGWPVGVEDILFCFSIGGIASVIYEEIFGKKFVKRYFTLHPKWILYVILFGISLMYIGNLVLDINSMYISVFGLLLVGSLMLVFRRDLLKDAIFSGLLIAGLMFIFYLLFNVIFSGIIQKWWLLKNISGILIIGVPLEELLWGFSCGFVAGPAYEFINGLGFKKP
jgi:hypothetical protein